MGLARVAATFTVGVPTAGAQQPVPAVVTEVVDGDTVDAQLGDGSTLRVRLIGIDTPERGECGTDGATAYMEQIVLGRSVLLVGDPTQDAIDGFGRSLFYIDRDDGLDVGQEMIRAGWAEVYVFDSDFQRLSAYLDAESDADGSTGACGTAAVGISISREQTSCATAALRRLTSWTATTGESRTASSSRPGGCSRAGCGASSVPSATGRQDTGDRLALR